MSYFVIISFDIANSSEARARRQEEHRARLRELDEAGRLLTAGPMSHVDEFGEPGEGKQGSLIIASFESLEAARQWANVDPFNAEGVYMQTDVYPYDAVFGA